MFNSILIANRGEIAVRIMRTARRLGVRCVAVYSDVDAGALHVTCADEAYRIGGASASDSYLRSDKIIKAAKLAGVEAIHPGYGFLSENADFVEACVKAGLTFIGPPAAAMRAMGLKDAAKTLMAQAGVPVVPGYHGGEQGDEFLAAQAKEIGFPVLIKARAGGGGKGMRLVHEAGEFLAALQSARREAAASFGDDHVLIENYVGTPRHIEVQIFGDTLGNIVHLFERDCSLQRRHQKVIEEAPAPGMSAEVREVICNAAVQAARAVGYVGAGTVEFIANGAGDGDGNLQPDGFWFMEMNTRLQVEHPVTEAITGQDLVEWQLRVASGEPLPLTQDQLRIKGHAFEARLYAEDASKDFMPAIGRLEHLHLPYNLARIDAGVRQGDEITPHYDPMIAKLITHGGSREIALNKMSNALEHTVAVGCVTNASFLLALTRHEDFVRGDVDTGLIERNYESLTEAAAPGDETIAIAALAALDLLGRVAQTQIADGAAAQAREGGDPWQDLLGWAQWQAEPARTALLWQGAELAVAVSILPGQKFDVATPEGTIVVSCLKADHARRSYRLDLGGRIVSVLVAAAHSAITVVLDGAVHVFHHTDPLNETGESNSGDGRITAPLPGLVKRLFVERGETVKIGAALVVIEAMKMEHTLRAPLDGDIVELDIAEGDQVADGALLMVLAAHEARA